MNRSTRRERFGRVGIGPVSRVLLLACAGALTLAPSVRADAVQVVQSTGAEATWSYPAPDGQFTARVRATLQVSRSAEGQMRVEEWFSISVVRCASAGGCVTDVDFDGHKVDGRPANPGDRDDFQITADPAADALLARFATTEDPLACTPLVRFTGLAPGPWATGPGDPGPSSLLGAGSDRGAIVDGDVCTVPLNSTSQGHMWSALISDAWPG